MIHHGNPSARLREVFSRIQAERMADVPLAQSGADSGDGGLSLVAG